MSERVFIKNNSFPNYKEMKEWCTEYFDQYWETDIGYYGDTFIFQHKEDAILFKLRWV